MALYPGKVKPDRKFKRLILGGGQAYGHSGVQTAVVMGSLYVLS
jgi:hypothetical protein